MQMNKIAVDRENKISPAKGSKVQHFYPLQLPTRGRRQTRIPFYTLTRWKSKRNWRTQPQLAGRNFTLPSSRLGWWSNGPYSRAPKGKKRRPRAPGGIMPRQHIQSEWEVRVRRLELNLWKSTCFFCQTSPGMHVWGVLVPLIIRTVFMRSIRVVVSPEPPTKPFVQPFKVTW